jgi:hypothetical protein
VVVFVPMMMCAKVQENVLNAMVSEAATPIHFSLQSYV